MSNSVRVLVLEDSAIDAELLIREIRRAGFDPQWTRVETEAEFITALESSPELILSDYSMPQFDGLQALKKLRESGRDIPFILVSGTIGEEVAVDAMRQGATDYLLKDRLARLGSAVERALQGARLRQERRLAEERLNASEERYRRLFETAKDGILILNAETGMVDDVNPFLIELLGFSKEQFLLKKIWDLGFLRNLVANEEKFLELQQKEYVRYEGLPLEAIDGRRIEVEFVSNVYEVSGRKVIQCNIRDITARVLATAESKRHHEELQLILDTVPAIIFYKDRAGRFMRVNRQLAQLVGASPEAFVGRTDTEMGSPAGHRYRDDDLRVMNSGVPIRHLEERLYTAVGIRHLLTDKVPFRDENGQIIGIIGLAVDITDRKLAEESLRQSEARLRIVTDRARVGLVVVDQERRYVFANAAFAEILSLPTSDIVGQRVAEVLPAVYEERIRPRLDRAFAGERVDYELRMPTPDGPLHYAVNYEPVKDGDVVSRVVVVVMDITERKQTEVLLRMQERAIQATTQGIVIADSSQPDCPIIFANTGFESITGYSAAEAIGRNCRFLQGRDTGKSEVASLRDAILEERPITVELLNYRKDGTAFWNEISITPVRDASGRVTQIVGVQSDVTARRCTEEQLRQSQKMEAVGQLAGGVAHDFNNLLTIIDGYTGMLLDAITPADHSWEFLQEIRTASERAADLTGRLLTFGRRQIRNPEPLDLNSVVGETIRLLGRLLGDDVELDVLLDPHLKWVWADRGQISQILLNLAINARDSMSGGGLLSVRTENLELTESRVVSETRIEPGHYIVLSVTDTGCGMAAEVLARVFEPFFTTKPQGKGTGLGLATVHGIVMQMEGGIEILSKVGTGTSFRVYLPGLPPTFDSDNASSESQEVVSGLETILLVEDDHALRKMTHLMLASHGYTVLEAADGRAALQVFSELAQSIQLLITDIGMPGMNGLKLAEQIVARKPSIRVMFMSGYVADNKSRDHLLRPEVCFLQKPFSASDLLQKVREVLDA